MLSSLRDKVVLVTGGTRGIGLATGLAFGRAGSRCILTHRWGSADESEIRRQFAEVGAPPPLIVEADVSNDADTDALLETAGEHCDSIDVFVSNVAVASLVSGIEDYVKRDFLRSIEYSTWPMAAYTKRIHAKFGAYPRYIVGLSSTGHLHYNIGYDAVAVAKSALEALCRFMAFRLGPHGVTVNLVRPSFVDTEAAALVLGKGFADFIRSTSPTSLISPGEVANVILALCSGLMDGVSGQIIQVDRGAIFSDTIIRQFELAQEKRS